jgi:acyl-CoA reductase-like NAD-dependent aldehyde dehydrogenase
MANASAFQLSASVWTGDAVQGQRVALQLQSGTCAVNDVIRNIGNPACAFGGNRASGNGRYHGVAGFLSSRV